LVEGFETEFDQQHQRVVENTVFIDFEHIFQKQPEILIVHHYKLVDRSEKFSEGIIEPFFKIVLLERFGLRCVSDFFEGWPQNAL
jgi:hypothetical protein